MTGECPTPGCGRPLVLKGLCRRCYARVKAGVPLDRPLRTPNGEASAWLRNAVASAGDECQIWPYYRNPGGYGKIQWGVRSRLAHHIAMLLAVPLGSEPPPTSPLEARHLCGRGADGCVNWRHLKIDTHTANEADKVLHGTSNRGGRCAAAKLTEEQVLAILADQRRKTVIAREYRVDFMAVHHIKTGATWSHLTGVGL